MFVEYKKYYNKNETYEEQLQNVTSEWKEKYNFISPVFLTPQTYDKLTLTKEECNELIILANTQKYNVRRTLGAGSLDVSVSNYLEPMQKAKKIILDINKKTYNYSIDEDYFETVIHKWQYGLGFNYHFDCSHARPYCKYTASIQLSDSKYYKGGDLVFFSDGQEDMNENMNVMSREQGSIVAFPTFYPHKVTRLLGGYRYSLIFFFYGEPWK